ncbi:hypothetical protein [Sphingomonas sp. MS122]
MSLTSYRAAPPRAIALLRDTSNDAAPRKAKRAAPKARRAFLRI